MKYRVEVLPALEHGSESIAFEYETIEQATAARDAMADLLLFVQDEIGVMDDYSNLFSLEQKEDGGEWEEVEED